jgi:hypothetical protein
VFVIPRRVARRLFHQRKVAVAHLCLVAREINFQTKKQVAPLKPIWDAAKLDLTWTAFPSALTPS